MKIDVMKQSDIDRVIPMYLAYYNGHEGGCWTETTAKRRIRQVLTMEDAYSLIMEDAAGNACGFAMGYFKQYDDIVGYTLEEILIAAPYQNRGLGSLLLAELEARARAAGASCVELQAVNDALHERYYTKAGYRNAKNFVMKVKWFV